MTQLSPPVRLAEGHPFWLDGAVHIPLLLWPAFELARMRAGAGAEALDERHPNWLLDLRTARRELSMSSGCDCVLAQLNGAFTSGEYSYDSGVNRWFGDSSSQQLVGLGFVTGSDQDPLRLMVAEIVVDERSFPKAHDIWTETGYDRDYVVSQVEAYGAWATPVDTIAFKLLDVAWEIEALQRWTLEVQGRYAIRRLAEIEDGRALADPK